MTKWRGNGLKRKRGYVKPKHLMSGAELVAEAAKKVKNSAAQKFGTPTKIKDVDVAIVEAGKDLVQDENFLKAMYVDWMADPTHLVNTRSQAEFCLKFKCPTKLVKAWTKDKDVQDEIRKTVRMLFGGGERIKKLYDRLWQQADAGIISAIRLALELTGEYTPKLQHLDKPKSLEDMLDQMAKADEAGKAGVYTHALREPETDGKPSIH